MNVNTLEHFLFKDYTSGIKKFLEKTCYLNKLAHDQNVVVFVIQPEKAFVKFLIPIINGTNLNPTITFSYSPTIEYLDGQNILGFVKQRKVKDSFVRYTKPELIYSLIYTVNIFTKTKTQADVLLYQILNEASRNAKSAFKIDGQWVEIEAINPRDETNILPAEASDVSFQHSVDLKIPRAYLPREYKDYDIADGLELTTEVVETITKYSTNIYDYAIKEKINDNELDLFNPNLKTIKD